MSAHEETTAVMSAKKKQRGKKYIINRQNARSPKMRCAVSVVQLAVKREMCLLWVICVRGVLAAVARTSARDT